MLKMNIIDEIIARDYAPIIEKMKQKQQQQLVSQNPPQEPQYNPLYGRYKDSGYPVESKDTLVRGIDYLINWIIN